jgi:hypothetical protein
MEYGETCILGNQRVFKLFRAALLKRSEKWNLTEKSTKSIRKVSILALDMAV